MPPAIQPTSPTSVAVTAERSDGVARITLNRPEVLNAMDEAWVDALDASTEALVDDPSVDVIVVSGEGRAFCAGLDLGMLAARGMPEGFYAKQERAFRRLELGEPLAIAALHGYCLGGGLQLAISCDLRIASSDAMIGLPATNEGLFPGMSVYRLPRLIGLARARRLILSGEMIDAETALSYGLVDHVVAAAEFDAGVERLVEQYRAAPRAAAIASKQLLASVFDTTFDEAYERSVPLLERCLDSEDVATAAATWRGRGEQPGPPA